jgi:hypothetical protein
MKKCIVLFSILVVMILLLVATLTPKAESETEAIYLPVVSSQEIIEWVEVVPGIPKCVKGCDETFLPVVSSQPIEYIEIEVIDVKCVSGPCMEP